MPRGKGPSVGSSSARSSTKLKNSRTKTMMPRKCSNCGVTRTPQWREGPVGPKTLCNACGVKYSREKGGRRKPARKSTISRPRTVHSIKKSQGRIAMSQEQSAEPPFEESDPTEDLAENKGHSPLVVIPHTLQRRPSLSPSEAETLFDKDDYQAAETILRISRSESPAADCYGAQTWNNTFCEDPAQATGLRRSLRVQLKRERQILCAGCHGCDQSPSFRHQSSRFSQEKNTAVVALPPQKRKLEDFDLSLIVEENNGDLAEMLHFVQCELRGAEERADSAEKDFLAAKKAVEILRSKLGEIVDSLDKVRRSSGSPDGENTKRMCL